MIGQRIRNKRKEMGYNLQDLADKTSLTPGFISQIERDMSEPSISSLRKIAEALNVAMFYFLIEESEAKAVVRKEDRQRVRVKNSDMSYQLLSPDLNRKIELIMGELDVNAMTSDQPQAHAGEEVIFVLEGRMWIKVADDEHTLEAGDTIYYLGSMPHLIKNIGTQKLVFISAITPPLF